MSDKLLCSHRPDDGFAQFWTAYPKRKNKLDALKAWRQTHKDRPAIEQLLSVLERECEEWSEGDPQYIPLPATWLRKSGFLNEPAPKAQPLSYDEMQFMRERKRRW